MKRTEFDILLNAIKNNKWSEEYIAKESFTSLEDVINAKKDLLNKGMLSASGEITAKGLEALGPYKVDNAIIMAAGLSSRCFPLSKIIPKGLFVVKGEVLIEREIRQLQEVGIENIILVTGYLKEKFGYLREKYGVTIVENLEYKIRNNTSSIFAARKYLGNSYICCADNYFPENIFDPYVFDSYYTCKYTNEFLDEFCLTSVTADGYIKEIKRGGKDTYYTMGAVFFSKNFSKTFISLLEKEYEEEDVKGMLIDTFHVIHMEELPSTFRAYNDEEIKEFDTLAEFEEFDPEFKTFYSEMMKKSLFEQYQDITRYSGVPTDWVTGRLHYNENLWGPSPKCMEALYSTTMEEFYLYDSSEEDDLLFALEANTGIPKKNIFLHNGSAESIKTIFNVLLEKGDNVLIPTPGWSYYSGIVEYKFGKAIYYEVSEKGEKCKHDVADIMTKARKYNPKIIVITSPAMPTGNSILADELEVIISENPGSMVVVDEAYYGFSEYDLDVNYLISKYDNVVFSRTLSKYYGLANLRIGYGICSEKARHALWLDLPLHKLPHICKRIAIAALNDKQYYEEITRELVSVREWFWKELSKIQNVKPFISDSNFIYIALNGFNVDKIKEYMEENGYLIRVFDSQGEQHLRITIAPKDIMEDCLIKLKQAMEKYRI